MVGSANLTLSGLRGNHESAIVLDTRVTPDAPCGEVLAAIRAWADTDRPARRIIETTLDQVVLNAPRVARATTRVTGTPKLPPAQPLGDLINPALEEIEAIEARDGTLIGVPTGFADLDELTNGLHPGQVIVIGGRPALGKSMLCLDIARSASIKHRPDRHDHGRLPRELQPLRRHEMKAAMAVRRGLGNLSGCEPVGSRSWGGHHVGACRRE
ncbi:hypothetical protein E0F15_08750 [Frankia sp. B2]|nr:hypothetical protein E0F15_08750 [Frankia sp. B2]